MMDERQDKETQESRVNTDQQSRKQRTYFDDYYSPFVRYLTNTFPEFKHLQRRPKRWTPPKGLKLVKYSTTKRREVGGSVRKQKKGSVKGQRKNYARKAG